MPEETTPVIGNSVDDVLQLAELLRPSWTERTAAIPAWHPRCEGEPDPAAATAQIDWESTDNPYLKRFQDTQSEYTRNQQALRQLETDRDAYIALGQKHGFEFEFDDPNAGQPAADPAVTQTQAELAELRQWKTEVEAERQQTQFEAGRKAVEAQHNEWAQEAGITLADFDHAAIIQRALDSGATTLDDAKGIFDAYVAHETAKRDRIIAEAEEARKRPRVPHTPGGGGADTGVPDFSQMTEAQALAWQVERARGITAAQ